MVKKEEAVIASNFADIDGIIQPQIWTSYAFTLDGIAGYTVSMQREDYTFSDWATEFAGVIRSISLKDKNSNIIGGLMLSADEETYIVVSLHLDNLQTVINLAAEVTG